ncbi:MAG: hypothetical protein KGZ25_06240 [Planctomycetes bacterium]|nr:hypothetical protein [Planctomycetota bacterium]
MAIRERKHGNEARHLLEKFIQKYPGSLHPIRVFLGTILAEDGKFDEATQQARTYLRCVRDSEAFEHLSNTEIIRKGVSRALLLITSAYTTAGARSYSKRVLQYAQSLQLVPGLPDGMSGEIARLNHELEDETNAEIDRMWEELFADGSNVEELCDLCMQRNLPNLARRADLISSNVRLGNSSPQLSVKSGRTHTGKNDLLHNIYQGKG